jgi:adenine-specific DNA-methyltransferase
MGNAYISPHTATPRLTPSPSRSGFTCMSYVQQFKTVSAWRAALGLLPIPLRASADNGQRYVLLNGTTGNFCLDFIGGLERKSRRDAAWSCDVGHYVTCVDDSIIVNRWDKHLTEESYSLGSVTTQLHEFHRHLEKTSPDRSRSIVAHVLRVFRQIRTAVDEQNNAHRSLRILLHLLASAATEQNRLDRDFELWGLTPDIVESSRIINDATWYPLRNDLAGIGRSDDLRPDLPLVLRHSSGAVFQEAHVEAELYPTRSFPGFERPAIVSSRATPSETGIYFTPPALARTLAEEATREPIPHEGRHLVLFDPACGSGELLKECLRLLNLKDYRGRVRVIGWDKSSAAVDMARFVLAWEKRSWPIDGVDIEVVEQDSLTAANWPADVDILVMNPPFRSWQRMEPAEQEAVTNILGASNKPNLAMAFARRALDVLREGGTLAMITPNSLLEASSGTNVRAALAEILSPQLIARLGEQSIFARALVDAGIYVGKRSPVAEVPSAILWADSRLNSLNRALRGLRKWRGSEAEPITDEGFSIYRREDIGRTGTPWVARNYDAWSTYKSVRSTKRVISARRVFDIKQGVRLGNDVFIVPKEYVQKLPDNEKRFFRPAVMNLSISDARLNDKYYVFYPYSEGLPVIATELSLEENVPTYFQEFLLPAKPKLESRKSLVNAGLNWWDLLRHRSWQMERSSKIVSKYFGKGRSFSFDSNGDFVVVVGSAWLLRKGAIQLDVTEDDVYFAILAYLSSSIAEDLLKYLSIQVSGGQWDLSHKYVNSLPIPDLTKLGAARVSELVQMGIRISEGQIDKWADVDELLRSILEV